MKLTKEQFEREGNYRLAVAIIRTLRGEGDAEATRIYAETYGRSPELFEFMRTMDAYRGSLTTGRDTLVLKPDSEFFRFFGDASGGRR